MFRKVLKHDINAIIKLWSVLTATVMVLSVLGGLSIRGLSSIDTQASMAFIPLYLLGTVLSIISISVYSVATIAMVMIRFYRNFFTDEGYLTFTLPVKRSTLFNSKLLTAFIFNTATAIITALALCVLLAIAPGGEMGPSALAVVFDSFEIAFSSIKMIMNNEVAFWVTVYSIVGVCYLLVMFVHETLLLFCTVTFGSILAKKHKILMSIGVYYGVQMLLSTFWAIIEVVLSVGIESLVAVPEVVPGKEILWLILGIMIFYVCTMALIASFFYKFAVSKLRGNLNLA